VVLFCSQTSPRDLEKSNSSYAFSVFVAGGVATGCSTRVSTTHCYSFEYPAAHKFIWFLYFTVHSSGERKSLPLPWINDFSYLCVKIVCFLYLLLTVICGIQQTLLEYIQDSSLYPQIKLYTCFCGYDTILFSLFSLFVLIHANQDHIQRRLMLQTNEYYELTILVVSIAPLIPCFLWYSWYSSRPEILKPYASRLTMSVVALSVQFSTVVAVLIAFHSTLFLSLPYKFRCLPSLLLIQLALFAFRPGSVSILKAITNSQQNGSNTDTRLVNTMYVTLSVSIWCWLQGLAINVFPPEWSMERFLPTSFVLILILFHVHLLLTIRITVSFVLQIKQRNM
jgi:hypothetical protein